MGEVELDEAVVEVMGAAEDTEVRSAEDDVVVAHNLLVAVLVPGSHGGGRDYG